MPADGLGPSARGHGTGTGERGCVAGGVSRRRIQLALQADTHEILGLAVVRTSTVSLMVVLVGAARVALGAEGAARELLPIRRRPSSGWQHTCQVAGGVRWRRRR